MHNWEVIVGNIGTVYSGSNGFEARKKYGSYVKQSKSGYGRAGGETVTLLKDGEIVKEHYGSIENPGWMPAHAVRVLPGGKVQILREKNPSRLRNISEGFMDANGIFHPIRSASDYSASAVGEKSKRRKKSRKKVVSKRRGAKRRVSTKRKTTSSKRRRR